MKPVHFITTLCFALLAVSCNEKKEADMPKPVDESLNSKFPEVKELSQFKGTSFILTPQSPLAEGRNAIYAPTMLYAWNEIKDLAAGDVQINPEFTDLTLLNYSKSFLGALQPGEYKTDVKIADGLITATAEFSKSLPFDKMFHSIPGLLSFKGQKVQSFGCDGSDYELLESVAILHYNNDDDFIVKLTFRDTQHEMLLCMMKDKPVTLQKMFDYVAVKVKDGQLAKAKNPLKYKLQTMDDKLRIPKLSFNIKSDYKNLVGNHFMANNERLTIRKAWQRTAFVLDESGAAAESEALVAVDSLGVEEDKPVPKKMIFNKPFLVVLKRVDSPNPYFAMWVDNTELMIKE